jgi:hypothetical protein
MVDKAKTRRTQSIQYKAVHATTIRNSYTQQLYATAIRNNYTQQLYATQAYLAFRWVGFEVILLYNRVSYLKWVQQAQDNDVKRAGQREIGCLGQDGCLGCQLRLSKRVVGSHRQATPKQEIASAGIT